MCKISSDYTDDGFIIEDIHLIMMQEEDERIKESG